MALEFREDDGSVILFTQLDKVVSMGVAPESYTAIKNTPIEKTPAKNARGDFPEMDFLDAHSRSKEASASLVSLFSKGDDTSKL